MAVLSFSLGQLAEQLGATLQGDAELRISGLAALQQAQQHASSLHLSHIGSAAFGLSLASMAHERQYSRLFRS